MLGQLLLDLAEAGLKILFSDLLALALGDAEPDLDLGGRTAVHGHALKDFCGQLNRAFGGGLHLRHLARLAVVRVEERVHRV